MEDAPVRTEVELVADGVHTPSRASRGRGCQPLLRNEGRDVLEFLRGREAVDRSAIVGYKRIGAKTLQDVGVPSVGLDHEIAVGLEIRSQSTDRLLESERFGEMIADRREAGPDANTIGVAPAASAAFLTVRTQRSIVSSVKNVCSTTASKARPPRASEFGPNAVKVMGMSCPASAPKERTG